MRVAVVGLGDIARKAYLPVLVGWEGLELFLHSRNAETVGRVSALHRIPRGTSDWNELLKWGPQAVFILSPSPTHFELAQAALSAGLDVFLEKPATMHSAQTQELADLAAARERVLMVGFNRRYAPLHVEARTRWKGRAVGLAQFQKHRASPFHPDLFSNYIDDTIHVIDLLRFYCGEAEAVRTVPRIRDGKLVGAVSVLALASGGHGTIATSLEAGRWSETYEIHGEGASLVIDAFQQASLVSQGEERILSESAGSWKTSLEVRGFTGQIAHFLDCVRTRREPMTSAADAAKTQRLLESLVAAAAVPRP